MENKIRLRAPEPDDLDAMYRWENTSEVRHVSLGDAPMSRHLLWEYITNYSSDIYRDRQLRLVIDCEGERAGTVDISDFDPRNSRAFLGIMVDPAFRGRHVGKAALLRAIGYCRDGLGLNQLAAIVPKRNEASLRLFNELGFKVSGCLESWLREGKTFADAVILQLML